MIRKSKNGIEWLEFELLQNHPVRHACVLRHGGTSNPPYDSLNLGPSIGADDPEKVSQNNRLLQSTFSLPKVINCCNVHKDHIEYISEKSPSIIDDCDGLITHEKNTALIIKHADCQVGLFYDPCNQIIAAVHSGWRGSVKNIYAKAVNQLISKGSNPKDIIVCISPSLGPENSQFLNYEKELPKEFYSFQIKPYYFDFWAISQKQLMDAGIQRENIEIAGLCTYSEKKDFFSYRREHTTGRNGTFIMLSK